MRIDSHPISSPLKGFTLIELLVVMSIMIMLCAIALPSWGHITQSSKLNRAAKIIHGATQFARQHAITHRQPTYLLFQSAPEYAAFSTFTIQTQSEPISQNNGTFISSWTALPKGIVFDIETDAKSAENIYTQTADTWDGGFNKNNRLLIGNTSYVVLGFSPEGETGSNTHNIYLCEGFYTSNGSLQRTSPRIKKIEFNTMGQSKISDL